ncbi:acyltransferase family protein [Viscerimonas tarda]
MNISLFNISRQQSNIFKGIAITFIVFHNIIHHTTDAGFNEMGFEPNRFLDLGVAIWNNPGFIFNGFFTYFGHFGVQVFLFISGYGLAKKYYEFQKIPYKAYYRQRLMKIYGLLIFGIVVYTLVFRLPFDPDSLNSDYLKGVLLTLTTLRNLSHETLYILSGPWWFFGLIIQLYLLFPFLFRYLKKYSEKGFLFLILGCYVLMYISVGTYVLLSTSFPAIKEFNFAFFGNFLGHTPEFLLGMAFALFPSFGISRNTVLIAVAVFIISNMYIAFFPLSFLAATVLMMTFCHAVYTHCPDRILKALSFLGKISMCIFLFNALIRKILLPHFADNPPLIIFLCSIASYGVIIVFSYLMWVIYRKVQGLKFKVQ